MRTMASPARTKLDFALLYAAKGIRVFPVRPNTKIAAIEEWPEKATTDPAKIAAWWRVNPDYNIGCAAGHGLAVIDADCKKDRPGLESLDMMMLEDAAPPDSFEVKTPSGGLHVYAAVETDVRNRVDDIEGYPGIDIRGHRGYVLGAGSTIDGKAYTIRHDRPVQPAPPGFHTALDARRSNAKGQQGQEPVATQDAPTYVQRAITYLKGPAPEAIEGAGGDHTTYQVAAMLKDFGITENTAFDLMIEHWNEDKASPPWGPEELQTKIRNAYAYGTAAPGKSTAEADFGTKLPEDYDTGTPPTKEQKEKANAPQHPAFRAKLFTDPDPATLPPRRFIYGTQLSSKFVSVRIAPGGVGKSSLVVTDALAMASGKPLAGIPVPRPLRTWVWNLEDPIDELNRRFAAAKQYYRLTAEDIGGRLFVNSGRDDPLKLAIQGQHGPEQVKAAVVNLVEQLRENEIDVLIVDPFVSMHTLSENDNMGMDMMVKLLGWIADKANVAILVVHHTRKGGAGAEGGETTAESARGAKALTDGARDVEVLNRMSHQEAVKAGLVSPSAGEDDQTHRLYFRAFSDKMNMAPPAKASRWFKLENVKLLNGDEVGVAVPWQWPEETFTVDLDDIAAVQRIIEQGEWKMDIRSGANWAGVAVAEALHLDPDHPAMRQQIAAMVKAWIDRGWLARHFKADGKHRNRRTYVVVGERVKGDKNNDFRELE